MFLLVLACRYTIMFLFFFFFFNDTATTEIYTLSLHDALPICTERDDVLLTAAGGQCIRFPVTDVRVFSGRTSMGVRGIALADGDRVISLSILRHVDVTSDERSAYLKMRRAVSGDNGGSDEV